MTFKSVRSTLAVLFLASLAAHLGGLFYVRSSIWPEEFQAFVLKILAVYSVPLAVVIGGIVVQPRRASAGPPQPLAWAAVVLTLFWNGLLLTRSLSFVSAQQDSVASAISFIDTVASASSFLVAGVISAYFAEPVARRKT